MYISIHAPGRGVFDPVAGPEGGAEPEAIPAAIAA